ncbi:MAG: hypothetical protein FJ276_25465 [Planctomycetes bacterium]|nr:hypothetical protein [Planctomycetota bacterium]
MYPFLPITLMVLLLVPPVTSRAADPDVTIDLGARTWRGTPSLERTAGGRVFVSWFTGGPRDPADDNTVVLSFSDDSGKTFSRSDRSPSHV